LEADGGKAAAVARRHRISDSLLYSWRSAWRAAAAARSSAPATFVPLGVVGGTNGQGGALLSRRSLPSPNRRARLAGRSGLIEIDLASGVRLRVDAEVNEQALRRVLQAMREAS
jgi:transposase